MKRFFFWCSLIFAQFIPVQAKSQVSANAILGEWQIGKMTVEIYSEQDLFFGKITDLDQALQASNAPLTDLRNPDKSLRSKPLMNMVVLNNFRYNPTTNSWEEGFIYNPETGQSIKATLILLDANTMEMSGFVGFSLSYVTETWQKKLEGNK